MTRTAEGSAAAADAVDRSVSDWIVDHRYWILAVLGAVLYLPFLGARDLWYADEPDIAEVCRTMFVTGDWISPRRLGLIWVDYPPLLYWAGSAASHLLGGISEFALRLPNALASIGMVLITCAAGSRSYDPRTGLWAGFTLLTSLQFVHQAISYRPDVLFGLMISAGIVTYAAGAGDRPRGWLRVGGFALFGLAMLAKGPLGLLLPGLVLTLWHSSRREWRRLVELAPLTLVALAVYLPWFVAVAKAMGSDNMFYEFYSQNFARFFGGDRGHARPFYYYLVQIWLDLWPWSLALPFALAWIHQARLWRDRGVQLALWWFCAFLAFLSVAVTKRHIYLLPAYPAAALLFAPWIADVGRSSCDTKPRPGPRPARAYLALIAFGSASLGLALFAVVSASGTLTERLELRGPELAAALAVRGPLVGLGLLLLVSGVWIGLGWRAGALRTGLVRIGLAQIPFYLLLSGWLMPAMNPMKTYRPESEWIRAQIGDATHYGMVPPGGVYYGKAGGLAYYAEAIIVYLPDSSAVDRFFLEHPDSLVLVYQGMAESIFANDRDRWEERTVGEISALGDIFFVLRGPRSDP